MTVTGPRAKKRLGQHFLHDPHVIEKIVAAINPARDDAIVEIGGGLGALTLPLLERVETLHVIEVDSGLADRLEEVAAAPERLIVHRTDALRFDLATIAPGPRSLRIVGNLPYNISTPLLFRFLEYRHLICDMHLMLQKEVVVRMTAAPGKKDYGRLTVSLAPWTELTALFDIGPGAFRPPPKVWSTVVRVAVRESARFEIANEAAFARIVAKLFSMRRKTLGRILKGELTPGEIAAIGLDPRARPETLNPTDFARLAALTG
jgi:16S rRNA (adenine1518-N6/adenine1519-N6)-dimethyltransferase